jgi:ABC-type branched-subunit amino acid transport system ATPase component
MADIAFQTQALRRRFGSVAAVDGVDLEVKRGEMRTIIGPNGAGKTTLFNLLTGRLRADGGRMLFLGTDVTRYPPHRRCRAGIGRTFQISNVFVSATVHENVRLALLAFHGRTWDMFASAERLYGTEADDIVDMVGLSAEADKFARAISYGDRRRLEIAIALACRPKLLLLDEPTCGVSLGDRPALIGLVQAVRQKNGMTVIMIEHDMDVVFSVADRITVMHHGRIVADDTPDAIAANAQVQEIYLGQDYGRAGN